MMKSSDVAGWARKFAKKGPGASVPRHPAPPPPAEVYPPPAQWSGEQQPDGYRTAPRHTGPAYPVGRQQPAARSVPQYQPVELDMLVKPGPSGYVALLDSLPDVSTGDYTNGQDAMRGHVNPFLQEHWAASGRPDVARPDLVDAQAPPKSFASPFVVSKVQDLAGGPAPPAEPAAGDPPAAA